MNKKLILPTITALLSLSSCTESTSQDSDNKQESSKTEHVDTLSTHKTEAKKEKLIRLLQPGRTFSGYMKAEISYMARAQPNHKYDLTVMAIDGEGTYTLSLVNHTNTVTRRMLTKPAIYKGKFLNKGKDKDKLFLWLKKSGVGTRGHRYPLMDSDLKNNKVWMAIDTIPSSDGINIFCGVENRYHPKNYEIPVAHLRKKELIDNSWDGRDQSLDVYDEVVHRWYVEANSYYSNREDNLVKWLTKNYQGASDEFDRQKMKDKVLPMIEKNLKKYKGSKHYKISVSPKLGQYDFTNNRFPLFVNFRNYGFRFPLQEKISSLQISPEAGKELLNKVKSGHSLTLELWITAVDVDSGYIVATINKAELKILGESFEIVSYNK